MAILGVMVAAWLAGEPSDYWQTVAFRLRCLWQGLLLASLGGFVLIAIPGWVVTKLGANPNSIFLAARYIWIVLAWFAVGMSPIWGARGVAAAEASGASNKAQRALGGAPGFIVLIAFVLSGARFFISDAQVPWSLPYMLCDFFFDSLTTDIARDECLAFRTVDDRQDFSPFYPGDGAAAALVRHGDSALPGIADYLQDRLNATSAGSDDPKDVSVWLLARLAAKGDHPVLQQFEKYSGFETRRMRQCILSGRRVVWTPRKTWTCGAGPT